jgi:hypothetical protein
MKKTAMMMFVLIGGAALLFAGSRSGGNAAVNDTTDSGGQHATSANYTMDGSLGGIGGVSTAGAPPETLKAGYIGQLTEVTNVTVIASPSSANENDVLQLTGVAGLDDATVTALAGSNIAWATPGFPIASITPSGEAATATVCSNTWGTVSGAYLGVSGSGLVLVLDSNPDNYGIYAGDGLPDWWQAQYFGTNNPLGVASATNCTGRSNLDTYIADLNPTDPASLFKVVAISNQPPNRLVWFQTSSAARVYRLLYTTNLVNGVWTNLPGTGWTVGQPGQMSLSDTNAAPIRFYRVQVQLP